MKTGKKTFFLLVALLVMLNGATTGAYAAIDAMQTENTAPKDLRKVSGVVTDSNGNPLAGATVVVKGKNFADVTKVDGHWSLKVLNGEELIVSFLGYISQTIEITGAAFYEVVLQEDINMVDEVVVVGYGVQKKATLTGAVAAVQSNDIVKTRNENIQNMLTGKLPGLRVVQQSSEPGAFSMQFDIRGMGTPLIIIDGVPRTNLERLNPNDVESISVLKDASAAIYGVQAANGVVLVTTKSGSDTGGKISLDYNSNFSWQFTSGLPRTVNALDFITLANEKGMNNIDGGAWRYPQEEIDAYLDGSRVSTDWYGKVIRQMAPQMQHNLNISGGGEKSKYFVSFGYQNQDSFFRSGDYNYEKFNIRSNISSKITKDLRLDVKLSGILDRRNRTTESARSVIYAMWRQYSVEPIYANDTPPYFYNPGGKGNPVVMMDKNQVGYVRDDGKWFQSSVSLQYKAPFLKGLSAKAQFSFDYDQSVEKEYAREYLYYTYDNIADVYNPTKMNSPSKLTRTFSENKSVLYQFSLNYDRSFGDAHNVNALVVWEGRTRERDGFYAMREMSIDLDELFAGNELNQIGGMKPSVRTLYANQSLVGRINYDYKGKYLIELASRYDGSSRFPASNRWGWFPSVSGGYRVSEESFWKNSFLRAVDNFKVRASYGIMGDDSALDYQFLAGYNYPTKGYIFDGVYVNGVASTGIPNLAITWYQSTTFNVGLDADAYRGLIGISVDVFRRNRTGLLATSQAVIPGTVGAQLPQENLNSDSTFGYEIELRHRNKIGDFNYSVSGNFSITRSMNIFQTEADFRTTWDNWKYSTSNRYQNIWWGLESGGRFQNYEQIAEHGTHVSRNRLPGDYYYQDWNGDGFIDENDNHPIGLNSTPLINYGLDINMSYKGFDLNIMFQGAAMANLAYSGMLRDPFSGGSAGPLEIFLDRWRPTDPTADPFDQRTSWIKGKHPMMGSPVPDENSQFNVHSARYLRLKNVELGYTLSSKWGVMKFVGIKDMRIYVNAYNLLTFSPLNNFVDPEHPYGGSAYRYPLNKTVSMGLNCKF
jgi:TonB-linked SusC/RagA family outer membrane protein